jgi:hypothetical protein
MALRRYGVMALWRYGVMALWRYGVMALTYLAHDGFVVDAVTQVFANE